MRSSYGRVLLVVGVVSGLVARLPRKQQEQHRAVTSATTTKTEEASTRAAGDWLAGQGIVGPGGSEEQHVAAKAARREKSKKKNVLTTTKRASTKWGDAQEIRELDSNGGWASYTHATATRSAAEIVIAEGERSRLLSHVLLASESMAKEVVSMVSLAGSDFEELARKLSSCALTRDAGGSIGWVDRDPADSSLITTDELLPAAARLEVMSRPLKPGDVTLVQSPRGFHVVKIDDVMLRDSSFNKIKRGKNFQKKDDIDSWEGKTYAITTMGCQMNAADSERLEGSLRELGLRERGLDEKREPDVVVVNTCSIRDRAEQKVYSHLGMHARRKRRGEDVTIVVAGCVAQQEGERLLRRCPEVDVVMGPQYANRIAEVLEAARLGEQIVATAATYTMEDVAKPRRSSQVCAWVNVAHGCNERCTYCVVPSTRGVEQSREPTAILKELFDLGEQGFSEATLLGQNVDAYGRDMTPRRTFADLLQAAAQQAELGSSGLRRIRFVTSHPRYISDRVVDVVASHPDVLTPVFHIPAQSGDDEMLRLMGRGYTVQRYLTIIQRIRAALPDATITSDFIVGCPGETEEMFQKTLDLMRIVKFDSCMTAAYSPRPGTPMARWDGASVAFESLGVDITRSSIVDELRTAVDHSYRALAKIHHPDASSSSGDSKVWLDLVEAKRVATAKLDEVARKPLGAFPPLSEIGPHQVDEETKERRILAINELATEHALERSQRYLGRVEEVLVEHRHTRRPTQVVGRTQGNKLVFINGTDDLINTIVNVEVTEANAYSLEAKLL